MYKVSIIIAAYNVSEYIDACVQSVLNQTLTNVEAVVVNDASTDDTALKLAALAFADPRVKVVEHTENKGLHLARKSGIEVADGEYVVFLDGDDDLAPDFCEVLAAEMDRTGSDIIHFGITAIAENGLDEHERWGFENYINQPSEPATGTEIANNIYQESCGYKTDWRTTQRIYRRDLAKQAFRAMTDERLERAEDSYETLVLSHLAKTASGLEEYRGLNYHYGRGVTGTNLISADKFGLFCKQFKACIDAACAYAATKPSLTQSVIGLRYKAIELLANDWKTRVALADKPAAADFFAAVFGEPVADRELYRFVRDEAYDCAKSHKLPDDMDAFNELVRIARLHYAPVGDKTDVKRCKSMRNSAERNIESVRRIEELTRFGSEPVRIFVSAHKQTKLFDSNILQPIQVGAGRASWKFENMLADDTGDNISELNPMYCELTAQYWAWKNVECDYAGFCHYRRYFNFSASRYEENAYGEIMEDTIDAASQRKYALDDESIRRAVEDYDVITTEFKDLRRFPGKFTTPIEHWHEAPKLIDDDLISVLAILIDMHPEYIPAIEAYVNGHSTCFCNMFIMRKPLFDDYCAWLFPILERFVDTCDMTYYSKETLRTPGHLSERLLNIYLLHNAEKLGWKTKQVQCVHFEHTDPAGALGALSASETHNKPVVPVVLAADTNYAPMLATTIASMLKNASSDYHYDINVFTGDFDWGKFCIMRDFFQAKYPNATLRMLNVSENIKAYELTTNNAHIGIETYFRFLIQDLLPFYDKVLYLDSDLIIQGDVSELFETDLEDNLLAAVRDIDFAGNVQMKDGKRKEYARTVLGMENPYDYFQAGVLVLNTGALRETVPVATWLREASDTRYIYNDQDILNKYCEGRVKFLDASWNVMIDCEGRIANVFSYAPAYMVDEFNRARAAEKIIHYAGCQKPWSTTECDRQEIYWSYAREMPFYENLLCRLVGRAGGRGRKVINYTDKTLDESSPLRAIIDPILPENSQRREAVRHVVLKVKSLR